MRSDQRDVSSVVLCLPSLLRREKMPGYANKQGAPTLNEVNIEFMNPITLITIVSHAPVIEFRKMIDIQRYIN